MTLPDAKLGTMMKNGRRRIKNVRKEIFIEESIFNFKLISKQGQSSSFTSDSSSELDVLRHYCDSFCMDGTQVGILEETD